MYYALVYYPRIEHKGFHCFRYHHEPFATLLPEHMPLIFPIAENIGLDDLRKHIGEVLANWQAFDITFQGISLSWDNWLMLLVGDGNDHVHKLHNDLYTGILKPFHRRDLPFTPHIAMGFFTKGPRNAKYVAKANELDTFTYEAAFSKAEQMELKFSRTVSELVLVKLTDSFSKSWDIESFSL